MDWDTVRAEFPITRNYNFQNHAGVAPISRRAADAARLYLEHAEHNAYLNGGFYKHAARLYAERSARVHFYDVDFKDARAAPVGQFQLVKGTPNVQVFRHGRTVNADLRYTRMVDLMGFLDRALADLAAPAS